MKFIHKLNWKDHIDHTIKREISPTNLLKTIAGRSWGSSKANQLKQCTALIKPKTKQRS